MSKKDQPKDAPMTRSDLKTKLIHEVLRAQKANMLEDGKANSSGNVMNIIKRLIPKR
jgi:hypothetical protein